MLVQATSRYQDNDHQQFTHFVKHDIKGVLKYLGVEIYVPSSQAMADTLTRTFHIYYRSLAT
jgi:hypothetical protein